MAVVTRKPSMSIMTRLPIMSRLGRQTTLTSIASIGRETGANRLITPLLASLVSLVNIVVLVALVIIF